MRKRSTAAQDDVVAAVGETLDVRDHAAAADRIHGRPSFVVVFPSGPQQHHADHAVARQSASATISRYRGSKMCSGRNTLGKRTTFGSGNSGSRSDIQIAIADCGCD